MSSTQIYSKNNSSTETSGLEAKVSQNEISGVYDSIASIYNIWAKLTESRARTRAIELAKIQDGQTILEVAVGTGIAFYEMVKHNPGGKNTGIDLSAGMLRKAKNRLQQLKADNYELQPGSAFQLPSENGSVDLLMNNYMFDLLSTDEMDKVLIEFKRVLKPGKKLVLVNMTKGERFGSGIYDRIYQLSPKLMGGCRGVRLSDKLKKHGFNIELREYYQQLFFPSEVIVAQKV